MNTHFSRLLPVGLLLAASSLSAQVFISGAGGLATETYSTAISTNGGNTLSLAFIVDYLVVGGGGGGAGSGTDSSAWGGGGGGAGGMLTGTFNLSLVSAENVYTITVGAGGSGGPRNSSATSQQGTNGDNSVLSIPLRGSIIALGGGGGGAYKLVGNVGGSGGGGGGRGTGNNLRTAGGAGTIFQGSNGGASRDDDSAGRSAGGGGGGAGGMGGQGGTDVSNGGNGGIGLTSSITGTSVLYAAGGGGGAIDTNSGAGETAGTGGSSMGGNGSISGNATAGATNTGSGGGGVGTEGVGGSGGSGIVTVRYKGTAAGTGGTSTAGTGTSEGYNLHTFTNTGNASLNLSLLNLDTRLGSVVSSSVSGSGALTINTQGTVRYTGTATHTGGTVVSDGTLQLGNGGTEGSLSGDVSIASGATLEYNRSSNTALRLSSAGALIKKGAGNLTITDGDVAFSGALSVNAGTLQLGSSFASNAANIVFNGGRISSDGASARTLARGILLSTSGLSLGDSTNNGALDIQGNLSLGMFSTTLNIDSEVAVSGVVSGFYGNVGLTKLGSSTLILSGNNTYSGNTTVSAGTLIVNGTQATGSGFASEGVHIIEAGATLGGSGTILGDTTISGIHTPGNSPGIQTFGGNLTYNASASVNWELAANTTSNSPTVLFDQIVVGGDLNLAGITYLQLTFNWSGSTVDWADALWGNDQAWTIYDVAGTTSGFGYLQISNNGSYTDANGDLLSASRGGAFFFLSQEGSDVRVNYIAPIPEPSTYGLVLGTLALAGAALRRRKQTKR